MTRSRFCLVFLKEKLPALLFLWLYTIKIIILLIAECYRPGHADYTFDEKYGFRDYRGGGRSSGRETIGRVAAGAIASKILESLNISIMTYSKSIGNVSINYNNFNKDESYVYA